MEGDGDVGGGRGFLDLRTGVRGVDGGVGRALCVGTCGTEKGGGESGGEQGAAVCTAERKKNTAGTQLGVEFGSGITNTPEIGVVSVEEVLDGVLGELPQLRVLRGKSIEQLLCK